MKLLIGYDGSPCSDAAIQDLQFAGLPGDGDALILTAAESWPAVSAAMMPGTVISANADDLTKRAFDDATAIAQRGAGKLQRVFPRWSISSAASMDSPASALLARADSQKPDLIVVGSHGHSAAGRFFLGSTSQSVLHHARCSVRIARRDAPAGSSQSARPLRLVLGVDGSQDSQAASAALGRRNWPAGTEVHVVGATDLTSIALAGGSDSSFGAGAVAALQHARAQLQLDVHREIKSLNERGLVATAVLRDGSAKRILVQEAEHWDADCVFLGARGMGRLTRLLIGSVSSAVATRAHCSVEIVRT